MMSLKNYEVDRCLEKSLNVTIGGREIENLTKPVKKWRPHSRPFLSDSKPGTQCCSGCLLQTFEG